MPKFREPVTNEQDRRNHRIYEMANKGANLSEIGRLFGITRERVRQIVNRQEELLESIAETRLSHGDK